MKSTNNVRSYSKQVKNSSTINELPSITKIAKVFSNRKYKMGYQNKSSYINSVKQMMGHNVEYNQLETTKIIKEQKQLKQILKYINQDTIKLVDNITPKKIKSKTKSPQNSRTIQRKILLKDKQYQNNSQILGLCKIQIQMLTKRSEEIINARQKIDNKIGKIIQSIKNINIQSKQLKWQNYKRGKHIIQQINEYPQLLQLSSQNQLLIQKVNKLRKQDGKVKESLFNLINSMEDSNQKYKKIEQVYNNKTNFVSQLESSNIKNQQYIQKQNLISNIKEKNAAHLSYIQFKYFRYLKNIESVSNNISKTNNQINQTQSNIISTIQAIKNLQKQCENLKKLKKQKQVRVNEYLKKNEITFTDNSQSDREQLLNKTKQQFKQIKDTQKSKEILNQKEMSIVNESNDRIHDNIIQEDVKQNQM